LRGTKTGVTTAGSLSDWVGKRVAMVQGWGPQGITTVALGGLEGSLAALRTKQVDSLILATEEGYQLEEKGEGRIVVNVGKYVTDFHTHVMFARDELIEKHPELVKRFVDGWFTTIAWMKANRDKTIELSGKVLNLSATVRAKTYDDEIGMMSDDGVFLLQGMASNTTKTQIDPWFHKYIFPNGELPSMAQLGRASTVEYAEHPTAFWLVRLMDLGFVIPLALLVGIGLLRRTAGADRGAYAFIGTQTLLTCAVAGMALRMWVRDDPAITAPLLIISTGGAAAFILLYVQTVRTAARGMSHEAAWS